MLTKPEVLVSYIDWGVKGYPPAAIGEGKLIHEVSYRSESNHGSI